MSLLPGVALVVGACSEYGKAVTRLLISSGCSRLVLGDVDEAGLQKCEAEYDKLGGSAVQIIYRRCDTSEASDLDQLITAAVDKFGEINRCANCESSTMVHGKTADIQIADFKQPGDSWQRRVWLALRAEVQQILKQKSQIVPSIVNITAAQGIAGEAGFPAFCASAHGIVGMTRATAMDYAKAGIRINCVCCGPIDSSLPVQQVPIGRYITADDVAHAVVFLLGTGASAITGTEIRVDGGWSLYHH